MSVLAGVLALATGTAYSILGVIAAYELVTGRRSRGWSHIGGAFMLMAATCGPHHLVHATHLLFEGEPVRASFLAALAVGLVPGAIFLSLRFEAIAGGRGDRTVAGTPAWLIAVPWLVTFAAGAIAVAAVRDAVELGTSAAGLVPNAMLFVSYTVVGVIILRTQILRRPARGGWSLSGLALGAVFPTCGLAHLTAGLAAAPDLHTLVFDVPGVPASLYFLWVVYRLNRHSLSDWARQPLVGHAAATSRRSPWASPPARPAEPPSGRLRRHPAVHAHSQHAEQNQQIQQQPSVAPFDIVGVAQHRNA
jgi:hypothetical protein